MSEAEPDPDAVREAQRARKLDGKLRTMIRESLWQIILLSLVSWVVSGSRDFLVFYQNNDLMNTYGAEVRFPHWQTYLSKKSRFILCLSYAQIQTKFETWEYVEETLLPSLFYSQDYRGVETSDYEHQFIDNMAGFRFGPPRLRQLRNKPSRIVHQKENSKAHLVGLEAFTAYKFRAEGHRSN